MLGDDLGTTDERLSQVGGVVITMKTIRKL
jgi:hypothetical protein